MVCTVEQLMVKNGKVVLHHIGGLVALLLNAFEPLCNNKQASPVFLCLPGSQPC